MTVYPSGGGTVTGPAIAAAGGLLAANNLSDLANVTTGRTNLGVPLVGVKAQRTTVLGIVTATDTPIPLESVIYDTSAFWNAGAPTRLTVPAGLAGKYVATATLQVAASAGGRRQLWIRTNGATYVNQPVVPAPAAGAANLVAAVIVNLAVADYVEMGCFQDSGGPLNTATGEAGCSVALERIG